MKLGRPISTPWLIVNRAGGRSTPSQRRYAPSAAAAASSAGANVSDGVRYGLNVTYAVSWLRQEENQYLSCPFEIARTLPDDLLRLMGYQRGAYALGYVDDLRDPLDVLRGRSEGTTSLGDLDAAQQKIRA